MDEPDEELKRELTELVERVVTDAQPVIERYGIDRSIDEIDWQRIEDEIRMITGVHFADWPPVRFQTVVTFQANDGETASLLITERGAVRIDGLRLDS